MKALNWLVILMMATLFAPTAFAKGRCEVTEMLNDKDLGVLLTKYNEALTRDRLDPAKCWKSADISIYRGWNKEILPILKKYHCGWDDLKGFVRVSKLDDMCPQEDIPVVPLVGIDGTELPLAPLVPEEKPNEPEVTVAPLVPQPLPEPQKILPEPHPALTVTKPVPSAKSYWMSYTGGSVGVAGLALLATGAYFGKQANSAESRTHSENTQLAIDRFNREASDNARNANILFGVGGAALAVGVTMIILDFTVWGESEDKPSATIGVGPNSGNLTVRF